MELSSSRRLITCPMLLGLFLSSGPFLQADYVDEWGPAIGANLPDLSVLDVDGEARTASDLSGENGLLLFIVRATQWDGVCKRQLEAVNARHGDTEKLSVGVAGISYDSIEFNKRFHDSRSLVFPILSDQEFATVKALGVLDETMAPNYFAFGVSRPGVLFIAPDGVVKLKWALENPDERPDLQEVLSDVADHLEIELPPPEPEPEPDATDAAESQTETETEETSAPESGNDETQESEPAPDENS